MTQGIKGLAFPTILASTVHDMKNSLGMMLRALDAVIQQVPEPIRAQVREISVVQYEAARVNNDMMQLLALYKLDQDQLPLSIEYHNLLDFFDDLQSLHMELLHYHQISVTIDCDADLAWFFDYELMLSALGNVLTNTIRYSRNQITLSAEVIDDQIWISVADDGPGFPALMIEKQQDYLLGVNYSSGSTGLGLFFCGQIAALHTKQDKHGFIRLANNTRLSGGHFQMILP